MATRFGTDGVRGRVGVDLTLADVRAIGAAAAAVLGGDRWYVARDTRESGAAFEAALAEGLAAAGGVVESLGVAPTPAAAWLSAADARPAAVLSASHNPWYDNGVKLFAPGGRKLGDDLQARIQALLDQGDREVGGEAEVTDAGSAVERWADAVAASTRASFEGWAVTLDCANGAASAVAPTVFRRLGADVAVLHASPDGRNINERCGSTHPAELQAAVAARGGIGFAFDGDADRVLAVDHTGALVDGDQIIAMCAIDRHRRGLLAADTVVVTVMTNLGFRLGMEAAGITVVETEVGDRYVLEALDQGGFTLGGEQSGHVIFRDLASTGDGLLSAVQLLDVVIDAGENLRDLAASAMTRLPQVLRNVRLSGSVEDLDNKIEAAVAAARTRLGSDGRVLIRPSGTEPLIRVMVEAVDESEAEQVTATLVDAVEAALQL